MAVSRRTRPVLWAALVAHFIAFGSFNLIAPLYALHLGAGTATIGAIVALGFLLPLLLALPAGAALPRIGLRRPLVLGPALVVSGLLTVLVGRGLVALAAAEVLIGLGHLGVVLAGQTAVGTLGAASRGEVEFGAYWASVAIGQMVGPLLAGTVGGAYGLRSALALAMAAAVLAGTILWLGRRHFGAAPVRAATGGGRSLRTVVRSPKLRYAMSVSGLTVLARTTHSTFLPVYLSLHHFGSRDIGGLVALLALVTVLMGPLLPAVTRLVGGRARSIVLALTLIALGMALMAAPPSWGTLLAMTIILGTGVGLGQPLSMVVASASGGAEGRGVALGYRLTTNRLTQLVTPAALGVAAAALGLAAAFLVAGGVVAAALPAVIRFRSAAGEPGPATGSEHE